MNGNAVYGERVVIVEVRRGHINLKTGRISSTGSSHPQADNQSQTVVWADRRCRPVADNPAEACEKSFAVDDIHLLKEQEARSLLDRGTAQDWFGSIYQDGLVTRIHHALKRLKRE